MTRRERLDIAIRLVVLVVMAAFWIAVLCVVVRWHCAGAA